MSTTRAAAECANQMTADITKHTPAPPLNRVLEFLQARFPNVSDVALLHGGAWSSAFAFRSDDHQRVIRFGVFREDYEKDRVAARWRRSQLPVPEVLEIGDAFGGVYALSVRHHGEALATLPAERVRGVIGELFHSLRAIRDIDAPGTGFGMWRAPSVAAPYDSWRAYLLDVGNRDDDRLRGWRTRMSAHATAAAVFERGLRLLERRIDVCPQTRKIIHADLLGNVLVAHDDRVNAVFDWGNSLVGDPLYDVAWLRYCAPWYPGLDPQQVMTLAHEHFGDVDLVERVACYTLHIALGELQYLAFTGVAQDLDAAVRRADALLEGLDRPPGTGKS